MNNKQELISIIVPVYNAEEYLDKSINSILNQTYKNTEIILVDDGSKDNSLEICKKFQNVDKRVKCIHTENQGVSRARNIGIDNATGEYIAFVDSDDTIEEEMYEKLYNSINTNKTDLSICNYTPNSPFKNMPEIISNKLAIEYMFDKDKFRGYVCNKLYKTSLIANQRFDKDVHICEDLLFNCEYILKCKTVSIVNENLYNYIKTDNSATSTYCYNPKRETSLIAYEKMIKLLEIKQSNIVDLLQISYIKENSNISFLKKKKGVKNNNEKAKIIYKKLINKDSISDFKKIEVSLYYKFPTIVQTLRKILYYINKNKR